MVHSSQSCMRRKKTTWRSGGADETVNKKEIEHRDLTRNQFTCYAPSSFVIQADLLNSVCHYAFYCFSFAIPKPIARYNGRLCLLDPSIGQQCRSVDRTDTSSRQVHLRQLMGALDSYPTSHHRIVKSRLGSQDMVGMAIYSNFCNSVSMVSPPKEVGTYLSFQHHCCS